MSTVKEILSIPALRKLCVIGGEQGLSNRVSYVTVMEVPDIVRWLKGNDFVITSLYAFKDDIKEQVKLVDRLADAHCSCLAVKTGQYVKELDPSIIERANTRGLVLVQIPREVTYIEIILNAMSKVLESRNVHEIIEKYMKDIIFNNYDDHEIIVARGEILGFNIRHTCSLTITLNSSKELSEQEIKLLRDIAKKVAKESDHLLRFTYNPVVTVLERSSILFFASEEKDIKNNLPQIFKLLEKYIEQSGLTDISIGVGSIGKGLNGLKESYIESIEVLKVRKFINSKMPIYFYDNMKIYLALERFLRNNDDNIFDDIHDKLDTDLLLTLETFYENNMDIIKTGEELFVHKNTVRYRLKKIKDITGYDTTIFEHNFNLYLFLIYSRIKGKS